MSVFLKYCKICRIFLCIKKKLYFLKLENFLNIFHIFVSLCFFNSFNVLNMILIVFKLWRLVSTVIVFFFPGRGLGRGWSA